MARSTIEFLKQQGYFNTAIAHVVGCGCHTVSRILGEPVEPPRRRRSRPRALEARRAELLEAVRGGREGVRGELTVTLDGRRLH
jgi:transposase